MGNKKKRLDAPAAPARSVVEDEVVRHAPEPAVPDGPEAEPRDDFLWLKYGFEALAVFVIAFAFFSHLQGLTRWVVAVDAYFHQKMALLIRESGPVKDFVWTTTSLFRTDFSDSSFLYHLMLIPFTFIGDEVVAIKMGAVFFSAVFFTVFYLVLRVNRCRVPFLFTMLLAACGSLFLYRLCQNRGYLLSMTLAMLTAEASINRRYKTLFALGAAYALSYTAFQVVIVIPMIYGIAQLVNGERLDRKLVPNACAGVVLGLLLHPNFPKDITLWWVQNFKVMWFKWTSDVNLFFGGELYPPELSFLTKSTTAVLITLIACSIATTCSTRRRSTSTITMFGITLFFGLLTIASKRFIEYSAPFTLAYAAFLLRDLVSDEDVERWSTRWPSLFMVVVWVVVAICGALLYRSYNDVKKDLEAEPEPGLKNAALWLKSHAQPKDIVYTADWDDFPQLWYYNSDQYYLICLDPMFFYSYDKDLWQTWFDTSNVRTQDVFNNIKLRFKARWVLVTSDFGNLTKKCNGDPRFKRVYSDKDCSIFQVLDELPDFLTRWSLSQAYANDRITVTEPLVLDHLAHPDKQQVPEGGVALSLTWRAWPAAQRGSFLDLERFLNNLDHQHSYAVTRIRSDVEQDAELRFGYDDAITVWQDGKQLFDEKGPSEVVLDGKRVSIKLPRGESVLCVRSTNYRGNWGFMCRLIPAKSPVQSSPFVAPATQ